MEGEEKAQEKIASVRARPLIQGGGESKGKMPINSAADQQPPPGDVVPIRIDLAAGTDVAGETDTHFVNLPVLLSKTPRSSTAWIVACNSASDVST